MRRPIEKLLFGSTVLLAGAQGVQAQTLDQQCAYAVQMIAQWEKEKPHCMPQLVLGATPAERARFTNDINWLGTWIYLDGQPSTAAPEPYLKADFNDLGEMKKISTALQGKLTMVCFDRSVLHYTTWTPEHLALVRAMLEPGGSFFVPTTGSNTNQLTGKAFQPEPGADAKNQVDALAKAIHLLPPKHVLTWTPEVPANWSSMGPGKLDPDLKKKAREQFRETTAIPALRKELLKTFSDVRLIRMRPVWLGGKAEADWYLACKP